MLALPTIVQTRISIPFERLRSMQPAQRESAIAAEARLAAQELADYVRALFDALDDMESR